MADVHWIKLDTDIFENRKIKYLRKVSGNDAVLIWILLLTMAGRNNDGGAVYLTSSIPYSAEMLADELRFSESVVSDTLQTLEDLGMIYYSDDGHLTISDWEEHQNVEGMEKIREQNRKRQKTWYDKKKAAAEEPNVMSNVILTQPNDTDKIREEKEKTRLDSTPPVDERFEKFWSAYPNKTGKKYALSCFKRIKGVSVEEMIAAIELQKRSHQWQKDGGQYIPNPSTWLNQGRWQDVVEGVETEEYKLPESISFKR